MHAKFAYFKVCWELFHKIRREELFVKNSLNYNQIGHVFFNLIRFVVKNMKSSGSNFHDKLDWIFLFDFLRLISFTISRSSPIRFKIFAFETGVKLVKLLG